MESFYLLNTEGHPDVLLRRLNGCNLEQFETFGHRRGVWTESYRCPDGRCLTDERPDGILRRPDGCKGTEFNILNSAQSLLVAYN
jgi:hypothetical protein